MVRKKPKIPQLYQLPQTQKSDNWFDRIASPYLQEYEKLSEEDRNKLLSYSNQTTKRNTGIGSFDPQAINNINSLVKGLLGVEPTTGRNSGGGSFDPETVKKQNAQNSWFKAGGLSDGYDFGDLTASNWASTGDFLRHVGKGAFGVAEGVVDTVLYGMSEASGLAGDAASYFGLGKVEDVARFTDEKMKELAMEDSATKAFGGTGDWLDEMSYLGGKTDSVAEGVGQVATTALLAKFGGANGVNPTLLTSGTMFASSLGRGITEALNSGASDEEAWLYGLISGTADAATEMLFGGIGKGINALGFSRGITSLDDIVAKNITGKISNTLMKNIAQAGIKGSFEGLEEVLAGFAQAWGKSVTYLKDEVDSGKLDFWDIVKDENLFEQWITGALTSAISSAPSVSQATVKGQDYITGYTQNDQAVIDRVIKDLIAEAEAAGQKLTAKDKANIKAKVEEDLEQGHISLDTIEETLGGDKYTAYQDTIQQENNALAELAELYEGDELQQKTEEFMANSKRGEAAKALRDSVFDLVKDSRLGESYREVGRRTQKFEVDLNQYTDEKQRAIVQKAVESGVLNNTNRTHDMVNWVSGMAAKMDTNFDFTNNEKLKDSIFAVDGKTVDGYVTKDGIVINVNSPKYINTVVGHEITHVLEGSDLYDALESTMIEYAKEKGTYQDVMKAAYEMYHNVEGYQGADGLKKIKKEAVANMVGDYLFTDQNFINHLAKNQNVFQKVWNEIKYMVKIARAGSNEHKKLLEVQRAFEKAYQKAAENTGKQRQEQKNTAREGDVKYSFAGINAETSDHAALDRAKEMQKQGVSNEVIRQETGWFVGMDGKWRFEVDDSTANVAENRINYMTLGELMPGAEIFRAYPEMKSISVVFQSLDPGVNAQYNRQLDHIDVSYRLKNDPDGIRSAVLHEIQHAIQNREGFTQGSTVGRWEKKIKDGFDARKGSDIREAREAEQKIEQFREEYPQLYRDLMELDAMAPDLPRGAMNWDTLEQIEEDPPEWQAYDARRDELEEIYGDKMWEFNSALYDLRRINKRPVRTAEELYFDTAGEIEARNVAGRRNLTAEERKNKPPILGSENTVFAEGDSSGDVYITKIKSADHVTYDDQGNVIPLSERFNPENTDIRLSLSGENTLPGNYGNYRVSGEEIAFDDMLPMQEAPADQTNSQTNQPVSQTNVAVDTEEDLLPMGQETILERFQSSRPDKAENLQTLIEQDRRYVETISEEIAEKEAQLDAMEHPYSKAAKELRSQIEQLNRKLANVQNNLARRQEALREQQENGSFDSLRSLRMTEEAAEEVAEEAAVEEAENAERSVLLRSELHDNIISGIKNVFAQKGLDFDKVLKDAKNLSTWETVDNTPQRVMEKSLGFKQGGLLADLTVNKVAQNETDGIRWLNYFTDKKNGLLRQLSDKYHIKPGSEESAAAQMYAEGFFVNEKNEIIRYGDPELIQDFPNAEVRNNIKALARDPIIRQIYDDTLARINASRTRNAYPEIPRLDNYFLHFRAMDDTFSRLGLPFNPNDIRAKDLPTDLNGVTADLKPGQPYFASSMHRTGKRTSFDLLGGLEKYLSSAKNQIYHIDDIQTLRALRNYIADEFGQAKGLEDLDYLSEEEAEQKIQQVYGSHLSTFAKFLNEEANVIAGKTALIDRGLEGIIGRRGITVLNNINQQVGKNLVGFNVSSSFTNLLSVAQAFAKLNKFDFVKALAQYTANHVGSRFGYKGDGFTENSPVVIRRKGAESFARTPWQKISDAGYVFMSAIDNLSTELIARAKYNELTRKGMESQTAHIETDKWVSRLMGDRSLGQLPQLYNSKMLGILTKFQLEVRNQLDSQFYDTIQEAKVSNEYIENNLVRNAKTAAKVASTVFKSAIAQHVFGMLFEPVAGYNPAFDIISVISTLFGWDDDEESEDKPLDNLEQAFFALMEDLPYVSTFTGGRIPLESALPIDELYSGTDQYGNEKSRWETLGEALPYYLLPGGYGQLKKTAAGLGMFDDDLPISGSYTDSGNLRYPVEENFWNVAQAGLFGQYANSNARDYFDQGRSALNPNQQREFASLGVDIQDYWDFQDREKKIADMVEAGNAPDMVIIMNKYLNSVRSEMNELLKEEEDLLSDSTLNAFAKNKRLQEIRAEYDALAKARYNDYGNVTFDGDYASVGGAYYKWYTPKNGEPEWRKMSDEQVDAYLTTKDAGNAYYATNGKTHYRRNEDDEWEKITEDQLAKQNKVTHKLGISAEDYWSRKEEYDFAYEYPERYSIAKTVGGYENYKTYSDILNGIKSDYDASGKPIRGSREAKVRNYIWDLDIPEEQKMILFKSQYTADDTYNVKIINYLNGRRDLTRDEKIMILKKLGFDVDKNGKISW